MRIGVDFDDVLYPYHEYLKRRIRKRWNIDLSGERITSFYYEEHPALRARGIRREELWKEVTGAWREVESHAEAGLLDPDAPGILKRLRRAHEIVLISARSRDARPHMDVFLKRHGIRPHEILLGHGEKRGFDVLIDDFPPHAEENVESGGYAILYTIDENSNYEESRHPRIFRVHSWKEIEETIRRLEARRPSIA